MHFSTREIESMIVYYYEKYEEKKVRAKVTAGKVVTGKRHIPVEGTVSFDVYEFVLADEGRYAKFPLPFDDDDLKKVISTVLGERGFSVCGVEYSVLASDPTVFTGINVTGEMVKTEDKTL